MRSSPWLALIVVSACSAPAEETGIASSPRAVAAPRTAPAEEIPAVPAAEPPREPEIVAAPPAWAAEHSIPSNGGAYVVHVSPAPDELPDNEPFQLQVWIADAAHPDVLARDVELGVAAAMPEHGHGMNRVPKAMQREDGSFLVDGMLFHMTGHWELYLDVTRGAVTERAQCDIVLE